MNELLLAWDRAGWVGILLPCSWPFEVTDQNLQRNSCRWMHGHVLQFATITQVYRKIYEIIESSVDAQYLLASSLQFIPLKLS
jgi:hypothetical protein